MIIIVDSAKPPQDHHAPAGQLQTGHLGSVLPYHTTTPLLPPPPPPPPPPPSYPTYVVRAPAARLSHSYHPSSPTERFFKAFALALLIYLAILSLSVHTIVRMAGVGGILWDNGAVGAPLPEDGTVLESIGSLNWTAYQRRPRWAPPNYPESAETSFVLPIGSEELYLLTRGAYQSGKVQLKQATAGRGDQGDVKVDVRVAYHTEHALARAVVCRLQKGGRHRDGVGIYTPTAGWADARDQLYFEVVFTFPPARTERHPLRINAFTTHTSNFAHEVGDLWQSMLFDNIELKTSNSAIRANSITLTRGSLSSSNGPISGHFNVSDTLVLHTSNGHIQATASLFDAGGNATQLEMRTSNSPITSSVSLITDSGSGGNFIVKARASNSAIQLRYDDAPLRSRLLSDVRTSNSPASVRMHPAFEGAYEVSTSNAHPVVRDTHPGDPSGMGRRRIVHQTAYRHTVSGTAYWAGGEEGGGGGGARRGGTTVHTSNARVSLDL